MNTFFLRVSAWRAAMAVFLMTFCAVSIGGPGAHGPGGEHIDTGATQSGSGAQRPRIETHSELFELVGYLLDGELSVMINRFESSEPVLNGHVEISSGSTKAVAKFHADHGDYAVDDPAFLKLLAAPGEHALIFTVIAGNESDLLEGTLKVTPVQAEAHPHGHSHWLDYLLIGAIATCFAGAGLLLWRRRARRRLGYAGGGVP